MNKLQNYVTHFERQIDRKVESVHFDGGSEFIRAFKIVEAHGVPTSRTTPSTPQSIMLAKRSHSIIMSMARTSLTESGHLATFWNYDIRHITVRKYAVIHSVTGRMPYEVLYDDSPQFLDHLKPFGFEVLYQRITLKHKSFKECSRSGICLLHQNGGMCYVANGPREDRKVIRTKHVRFIEDSFRKYIEVDEDHQFTVNSDSGTNDIESSYSTINIELDTDRNEIDSDNEYVKSSSSYSRSM